MTRKMARQDSLPSAPVDGPPGTPRTIALRSSGVDRWIIRANATAEAGSDAGSDLELLARTDTGAPKRTIFRVYRNNGRIELGDGVDFAATTSAGTRVGTAPDQKLGFWGAAAVTRPASVPNATGGTTVDTEARAAINALLARLRDAGIISTT